jgi:uncharacterized protein YkwD
VIPRFGKPPVLLVVLTACLAAAVARSGGLAVRTLAGAPVNCTPGADWGKARQDFVPAVLNLVNQHRSQLGLSQLKISPTLTAAALWKALHMAKYGYFAHEDPAPPVVRSPFQRMTDCGYVGNEEGENIAYGYRAPDTVMQAWLLSPGHRANIEGHDWAVIGIGVAQASNGNVYWVQDFGSTDDSNAVNRAPVARADRRAVLRNHRITIRVLRNDHDPDGDSLSVVRLGKPPSHGRVTFVAHDSRIVYKPARGFVGRDRFRYEVTDGKGGFSSAAVIVHIRR